MPKIKMKLTDINNIIMFGKSTDAARSTYKSLFEMKFITYEAASHRE